MGNKEQLIHIIDQLFLLWDKKKKLFPFQLADIKD